MAKKILTFKILPSAHGKSSEEVVEELVKQTINKVLQESQSYSFSKK